MRFRYRAELSSGAVAVLLATAWHPRQAVAQSATVKFTAAEKSHMELSVPAGWETLPVRGCKPVITRVTVHLYRIRFLKGYSTLPLEEGGEKREIVGMDLPARRGEILAQLAAQQAIATQLEKDAQTKPELTVVASDTSWNLRYAIQAANHAPGTLQSIFETDPPPGVRIVDPRADPGARNARLIPVTPDTLRNYGRWRFDTLDADCREGKTKLTQVVVTWTFQIPIDPNSPDVPFLSAKFSAPPAPPPPPPPAGGGANDPKNVDPHNSLTENAVPQNAQDQTENLKTNEAHSNANAVSPKEAAPGSPDTGAAATAMAQLLGIGAGQLGAVSHQPGIELVGGVAIPDNGPNAAFGFMVYDDRRNKDCDESPGPLGLHNIEQNLGLFVGRVTGSRGAYVIAPSLRLGTSAWAFAGGAFGDSNGTTRRGFVAGVTIRLTDVLGGGGGGGSSKQTIKQANVLVSSDKLARIGPNAHCISSGVIQVIAEGVKIGPMPKGTYNGAELSSYVLRVDYEGEQKPVIVPLYNYAGIHNLVVPSGRVTSVGVVLASDAKSGGFTVSTTGATGQGNETLKIGGKVVMTLTNALQQLSPGEVWVIDLSAKP
jgi:hypothetical protein